VSASLAPRLLAAARRLRRELAPLRFGPPVTCVYDPLDYAWRGFEAYVEAFGAERKRVVFVGMNPGPFGMAQTGVPFGDVGMVRGLLGIEAAIGRPAREHPKRPVLGFACPRGEVSGQRLWGAIERRFGTAERFFAGHFIANYCPLAFVEASGRNRTPDQLPARERAPLFGACDRHLRRVVELLEPEWVIGIGGFAEARAREALAGMDVKLGRVLHPSPASPAANRDWEAAVERSLRELGVCDARGAARRRR
jgi:single-strand selective monofunctional uracil DNA glycosylase